MTFLSRLPFPGQTPTKMLAILAMLLITGQLAALESDRKQPLEVNADATEGTLGDGKAILYGNVVIHQGSLLVRADVAEVEKVEGRVRRVVLTGKPVHLEQEIEEEGLVQADALKIEYEVATGIITLTGSATVIHPQYHVSGEVLKYDMNLQHFQGNGGDGNGRIRIELDPEVVPDVSTRLDTQESTTEESNQ
jgi:lipopolysaccharide export system protein LptA